MLVKQSGAQLPMLIDFVTKARGRQNIESEIFTLRTGDIGMAVDPADPDSARNVRHDPPARTEEVVAQPGRESEVIIFRPAKNRLAHREEINLIEPAQPTIGIVHCA